MIITLMKLVTGFNVMSAVLSFNYEIPENSLTLCLTVSLTSLPIHSFPPNLNLHINHQILSKTSFQGFTGCGEL
ncbi:hypothetical protein RJT34_29846 [Clitoria ternatea]|uniref:Uncharacterized protein n=1 Tax=Clitoria ternatea TaxID=43366 RepID=A0AAN9ETF8_CLITE